MSIIERLSSSMGRRDNLHNQQLAGEIALNGDKESEKEIFPYLISHLRGCRPKELAQHAEKTLITVHRNNMEDFRSALSYRLKDLSNSQKKRIEKILKDLEGKYSDSIMDISYS